MKNCNNLLRATRSLVFTALAMLPGLAADAAEDVSNLVGTCNTCHSESATRSSPQWPILNGQKVDYMARELTRFREGERQNPLMAAVVSGLSDAQIQALAEYYNALPPFSHGKGKIEEAGRDASAHCIACHGMKGKTVNSEWPNLAGQNAAYLEQQLRLFKSGERWGSMMNEITRELNEQEIVDVAEYYSRLQP